MPPFKSIEQQVPYLQGEKLDLPKLRQVKLGVTGQPSLLTTRPPQKQIVYINTEGLVTKGGH